ncbi:hypothetical protein NAT51_04130 [Flavobacterium amniphilum]|uniref:hypothetical protein n=1 Tax=Flavobacterium amniphilum TaxID=1834035 RepID=UPI00202A27C0|nr:hypothetical protein [Flavobacterium amniphilum]MCL9804696.1 hypothetical protein [Flavobacterium amniphilum]
MKHILNLMLWIALILSGATQLLMTILGPVESYGFNYFSAFISLFILLFSFVVILAKIIAGRFRQKVFQELKPELFLFIGTICIMSLSGLR